jgi:DNA helicase-2/ATP-dependent DNA helicase PcrA
LIEEKCLQHNVPYRMVGGVNFYQRKEIKDVLAYLKTIANGKDDLSALRVINVPKRGIGATSLSRIQAFASEHGFGIYDAFCRAKAVPGLGKTADKVLKFTVQIEDFRNRIQEEAYSIHELIEDVLDETGYLKELEAEGEIEYQTRLENIEELINKAVSFEGDHEHPDLNEFLEEVALVADIDRMDDSENRVTLMTLHSAKGLEFPRVYLSGMEDGLFPSMMSISSDDKEDVEEERRLCYVGITRAQKFLMMTAARQRMVNGETRYSKVSRFVDEIPDHLLDSNKLEPRLSGGRSNADFDDSALPWGKAPSRSAGVSSFGPGNNAYASKTAQPTSKPGFGKAFTVEKTASLNYKEGDRVSHIKFGEGQVMEIKDGGRDYEVTVQFDNAGVKKMFASFAKLKLL